MGQRAAESGESLLHSGLAPNASRLSVRFFLRDSFGAFVKHYQEHQERLNIVRPSFDNKETLSMWALLRETVNPNSKDKAPQPQLVGELLRSVLTGSLYPAELFMADGNPPACRKKHHAGQGGDY